ncbi:MAG: hypothetical protein GEV28_33645 [Actinophytocola sp.]|nr:hypothetical protein [Actinophytocola sp.]
MDRRHRLEPLCRPPPRDLSGRRGPGTGPLGYLTRPYVVYRSREDQLGNRPRELGSRHAQAGLVRRT